MLQSSEVSCSSADLVAAAWTIVKEWSEHQLGLQFSSLQALACYLVLNLSIGNGTSAANHVVSAAKTSFKGTNKMFYLLIWSVPVLHACVFKEPEMNVRTKL